jgi:ketosteroid isomerase-like protein
MSQDNVELIRRGYEAFARGDVEGVLDLVGPDVSWAPAIGPILGVDAIRGRDALRRFLLDEIFEGFDTFRAEPLSFEDLHEAVLVRWRAVGRGKRSGLEIDQTFFAVFTLCDGEIMAYRDYQTRSEALEAVGQRE